MRAAAAAMAVVGLAAGAAGCPGHTHGVRKGAIADARFAYLYGSFVMKRPDHWEGFTVARSMALLIRCQDGSEYVFGSRDKRVVQVLEIKPSRCWLIEAQGADRTGRIQRRFPIEPPLKRPLDFGAGRAYYAGDYDASGDIWLPPDQPRRRGHEWDVGASEDAYESTTADMKRVYPYLASLPTTDMRLIPGAARKRDNGIHAAPGEPPMSPDRVARLAPFIKRNYGAPAECEAACPAGQCLPYRADTGPAMTCVIRCDKDADCPEGLACNCPNAERSAGPACRPIATAPGDPMARVCLSVEAAGQRR